MTTGRTFFFAGGGSGGHLFPGLAVADELVARDPGCRALFIGSERGIERTILAGTNREQVTLPIAPPGSARRHPLRFAVGSRSSLKAALRLIDERRPEAVIGLGGFASVPMGVAAVRRGIPLILLEQNVIPGRATSWLSRWADRVCVSFEETVPLLPRRVKAIVTGNPVRNVMTHGTTHRRVGQKPSLLILGGSQGAAGVNAMAIAAATRLSRQLAGWQIVHQTGERDLETTRTAYARAGLDVVAEAFFPEIAVRYRAASLAISRAGATTLSELACVGCPALLVPYPGAIRDHQRRNAEFYAAVGGAAVVPEGSDGPDRLARLLEQLLNEPGRLRAMSHAMSAVARPDAAAAVASLLIRRSAAQAA